MCSQTGTENKRLKCLKKTYKSKKSQTLRMTCHPDPALREKDLLFFAPRDEVGD
jgi:hypothetical protein